MIVVACDKAEMPVSTQSRKIRESKETLFSTPFPDDLEPVPDLETQMTAPGAPSPLCLFNNPLGIRVGIPEHSVCLFQDL